ncbi:hypothetical protein Tco_0774681, partial [Tanacetum coccineum]
TRDNPMMIAGSSRTKRSRQYETMEEAETNEEILTYVAWIRAFNINEPIYSELCHEFYSTYKFDELCADDELGLYHAEELDDEGFDVYFQGDLRSDEHFNTQEYWLSISREENLSLSRSHASTIREPSFEGVTQDDHLWLVSEDNWVRKCCLVDCEMDEKKRSWYSEREYYYADRVDRSEGRLIPKDPQSDVPRVAIPRAQRASMQDLYERMGSMEIRQGEIDRMAYRQSYQWDRYAGVFEHMAGVYSVPLQGAYNPPGYAQPQYDQYYQQYPPQQQQHQQDDEYCRDDTSWFRGRMFWVTKKKKKDI